MQTNKQQPVVPATCRCGLPPLLKDRIFLFLAASAAAVLLILAVQAMAADTASVHGLILDSEMGAVLEADNGDIYFLEGPDMASHLDTLATVTGSLSSDEGGNRYIDVTAILPDLEPPAKEFPAVESPAPSGRGGDPLDMKDETGV